MFVIYVHCYVKNASGTYLVICVYQIKDIYVCITSTYQELYFDNKSYFMIIIFFCP